MSNQFEQIKRDIMSAMKNNKPRTEAYDTTAEVLYVDGDTAWVRIPGGAPETPVERSIAAKQGDVVQVRVANGRAWINGNNTAPPTDDTVANAAHVVATATHEAVEELEEHFWYDGNGAHVEGESYRNDMKSDGLHIVEKSTGETVAKFGADGSQLGKDGEARFESSYNALRFTDMDDEPFFELMDARNREGISTVTDNFVASGSDIFILTYAAVGNDITVYMDDSVVDTSEYEYTDYQDSPAIQFTTTPSVGALIDVVYTTFSNTVKHFTFGSRVEGERIGGMSVTAGDQNIASRPYAVAIGNYNQALDDNAVAIGSHLIADKYQAVFGKWNERDLNAVFIVGDGSSGQRANAFVLKKDGTAKTRKGTLTAQTDTTTWTAPTVYNSTCTVSDGGYMAEGKHVYIQLKLNLSSSLAAGTALQVFSGMPTPAATNGVLPILFSNNGGGGAYVSTQGNLVIKTPSDLSVTSSTNIFISGHYVTA